MSETSRSNAPWVIGVVAVIVLLGCCISGAGGVFLFRYRQEEQRRAEEMARLDALVREQAAGGAVPDLPADGVPRVAIQAVVETAFGASLPVRVGQTCAFTVENPERADAVGGRWCRTAVRCGDTTVYGGGTSGFFPCTFSTQPPGVTGADVQTSSADQDGALDLDTNLGRLLLRDDGAGRLGTFMISARITSVR